MADSRELENQIANLAAEVEKMRARIASLEGGGAASPPDKRRRTRRDMLKLGGAAALGAIGAAAMRTAPADAATGDNMVAGQANTANATTSIAGTGHSSPIEVFEAKASDFDMAARDAALAPDGQFGGALQGLGGPSAASAPDFREGVDGWASGDTAYGVYGLTDSGVGVTGESDTGISLYARGTGRVRQDPMPAGNPGFTPNEMEQVRDADGTLWLSNSAGNWRRATTFELFPTPRRVYGPGTYLNVGQQVLNLDATQMYKGLGPTGLPAGAVAAWCAVSTLEPAVLSFYPAGTPDPHVGSVGVMGTATISAQISHLLIPLNASGHFSFTNMKTKARVFIDVWGYISQSA